MDEFKAVNISNLRGGGTDKAAYKFEGERIIKQLIFAPYRGRGSNPRPDEQLQDTLTTGLPGLAQHY